MDRHQKPRERELYDRRKTSENFSINQLQIDIITKTEYLDKNLSMGDRESVCTIVYQADTTSG